MYLGFLFQKCGGISIVSYSISLVTDAKEIIKKHLCMDAPCIDPPIPFWTAFSWHSAKTKKSQSTASRKMPPLGGNSMIVVWQTTCINSTLPPIGDRRAWNLALIRRWSILALCVAAIPFPALHFVSCFSVLCICISVSSSFFTHGVDSPPLCFVVSRRSVISCVHVSQMMFRLVFSVVRISFVLFKYILALNWIEIVFPSNCFRLS